MNKLIAALIAATVIGAPVVSYAAPKVQVVDDAKQDTAGVTSIFIVVSVKDITFHKNGSTEGTQAGALLGGTAGMLLGGSQVSRIAAALGGAVIGGVAGNTVSEKNTDGIELLLRKDGSTELITVRQAKNEGEVFSKGDQVAVTKTGNSYSVTKLNTNTKE